MCYIFQLIFVSVLVEELLYCLEVRAAPAPAMLIRARSLQGLQQTSMIYNNNYSHYTSTRTLTFCVSS